MVTGLIGIAGKARSGKDTAANILISDRGYMKYSLAEPIRRAAKDILMIDEEWLEAGNKEATVEWAGVSYRKFAQLMGTEFAREMLSKEFWFKRADAYMGAFSVSVFKDVKFVIPDIRFEDEADWIRRRGGAVFHITRPNCEEVRHHVSEGGVSFVKGSDYLLDNSGSLGQLFLSVLEADRNYIEDIREAEHE